MISMSSPIRSPKVYMYVLILHSLEDHVICVNFFAILAYSIDTKLCSIRHCIMKLYRTLM